MEFFTRIGGNEAARMTINKVGNVGIGTANPSTKLEVYGNSTGDLYPTVHNNSAGNAGWRLKNNQGDWVMIANAALRFYDVGQGLERMRIDSEGNVGIGTTNPVVKLHLTDSGARNAIITSSEGLTSAGFGDYISTVSKASGASGAHGLLIGCYRPSTSDDFAGMIRFHQRNLVKQHLWFDNSGQLRVSTNGAHIGSDHEQSTVIGTQTSDERLKDIEDNFEYGLDKVMQLKPIAYKLKEDESQVRKLGFGAQTTQAIVPEVVFKSSMCIDGYDQDPEDEHGQIPRSEDTTLGMEYVQLIPVLTKAIQEQQTIIEDLKSQNESLVARIEALEG
jgi:hypothetical protein